MEELLKNKRFATALIILAFAGSAYLAGQFLNGLKQYTFIGRDVPAVTTINVSGDGEEFVIPNVAEVSFSVSKDAKTVAEAQKDSGTKINAIMEYLKSQKIETKDIQNSDYSVYPKYDYQRAVACIDNNFNGYCPSGKQILIGYTVSQTISVKIRELDKAGDIMVALGDKGATNISGLNFTVDTDLRKTTEALARGKAIAEAQSKAALLAKDLGVKLTRVVSFSENNATPYYGYGGGARKEMMALSADSMAPAPELPVGQSKIVSNVTITYEIQ